VLRTIWREGHAVLLRKTFMLVAEGRKYVARFTALPNHQERTAAKVGLVQTLPIRSDPTATQHDFVSRSELIGQRGGMSWPKNRIKIALRRRHFRAQRDFLFISV
jgi:hypothetical protein